MVDEPRDIPGGRVEVIGQLAQRHIAAALETEQDADAALAQPVVLSPALLEEMEGPAGETQGGEGLHTAHVDLQRREELTKPLQVEAAVLVLRELEALQIFCLHLVGLHYY